MRMVNAYGSATSQAGVMPGPTANEPAYTFACGKYRGLSPSMLRELTSLPITYPTISALEFITIASSGYGTSHVESLRTQIDASGSATLRGVALKNSSGRSARYTFV